MSLPDADNLFDYAYKVEPSVFTVDRLKEIARRKRWVSNLSGPLLSPVERDILTFDAFAVLAELTNGYLAFGGGTLLNWLFARNLPRFSFDIDSQIRKPGVSKEYVLDQVIKPLNDKLRAKKKLKRIEFGGAQLDIGSVIHDREKDHFPDVLSLKRPVYSLFSGTEAHLYLKKETKLRDSGEEGRRLKNFFGGKMPRIEDVRIEIGIPRDSNGIFPAVRTKVTPLVYPELDIDAVSARVTVKEYVMALKIFKLGRQFELEEEQHAVADFVKSICDLQACSSECDKSMVHSYLSQISEANNHRFNQTIENAKKRIGKLSSNVEALNWFKTSGQTSFIAQTNDLKDFIDKAEKLLITIMS